MLLIIVLLQTISFLIKSDVFPLTNETFLVDLEAQAHIDDLKKTRTSERNAFHFFPFNPNYINDFKGYTLGMSPVEIDKLLAYRAQNKFVNSAAEFQKVSGVSDSLLQIISPYFKFPEWTAQRRHLATKGQRTGSEQITTEIGDLNTATAKELKSIKGIGEVLSGRIVKFRESLGGFTSADQLFEVYGLEPEVAERTLKKYQLITPAKISQLNINTATVEELAKLTYLTYAEAKAIVSFREDVGRIATFNELKQIENFPVEKIDRIALYLRL